jgi:hypothetical protein
MGIAQYTQDLKSQVRGVLRCVEWQTVVTFEEEDAFCTALC